jgi:hypothetical protein
MEANQSASATRGGAANGGSFWSIVGNAQRDRRVLPAREDHLLAGGSPFLAKSSF